MALELPLVCGCFTLELVSMGVMGSYNPVVLSAVLFVCSCGQAERTGPAGSPTGAGGASSGTTEQESGSGGGSSPTPMFQESLLVVGGEFPMGRGGSDEYEFSERTLPVPPVEPEHAASVSSFYLDAYEVTVGRFRDFLHDFDGKSLAAGAGAHPRIEGSGWDPEWVDGSVFNTRQVIGELRRNSLTNWTEEPAGNESMPINGVTWLVAFQFCVWDGGRLPTEVEWEYAAAGGADNRVFPWGNEPATLEHANFGHNSTRSQPVDQHPRGVGRFGQLDLAGNVAEWVFDSMNTDDDVWYTKPCSDCARTEEWRVRVTKGGGFRSLEASLRAAARGILDRESWDVDLGFRCARDTARED